MTNNFARLTNDCNNLPSFTVNIPHFHHQRDNYRFLFELYTLFKTGEMYLKINFMLPSVNEARWNSSAIVFLMAHFFLPESRLKIYAVDEFIVTT